MPSYTLIQSLAARPLLFQMTDSADHLSAKTGLAPTVTISKNGGSFAAPAGAVTELASGWYAVAANTGDTDTLGPLILHATAAGADPSNSVYEVVLSVWDELYSDHLLPGTFGQALGGIHSGTALDASFNTIALDAGASNVANIYKDNLIRITNGTGAQQTRYIAAYDGFTQVATVSVPWTVTPDNTSTFTLLPWDAFPTLTGAQISAAVWDEAVASHNIAGTFGQRNQVAHCGVAQGGTTNTLILDAAASVTTGTYQNELLLITAGLGAGQARFITLYDGPSQTATVGNAWTTAPDATSEFLILAFDTVATQILTSVLAELPQATPDATPTLANLLMALYMEWRNATTATATDKLIRSSDGTVVFRAALSDDGTVFLKSQIVSGP